MISSKPSYCVIVPCYNHGSSVREIVLSVGRQMPVIVIDDGSTDNTQDVLRQTACAIIHRFDNNRGKGVALSKGLMIAFENGFTHAITIDADGQHNPEQIGQLKAASLKDPDAVIVGVRDFRQAGAPFMRRFANWFSNIWFYIETGTALKDSQCGYRCYPVERTLSLKSSSDGYGYELEILVHACWSDISLKTVPVDTNYNPAEVGKSHFRPIPDFAKIALIHTRLTTQALSLPKSLRYIIARGDLRKMPPFQRFGTVIQHVGTEHTVPSVRLALAVGLGLFCGIAPIWGFQMAVAAFLSHKLRLNKAISLIASNISIPVFAPFILAGGLILGHWLLYGSILPVSVNSIHITIGRYFIAWILGSILLALLAGISGFLLTCLILFTIKVCKKARHRDGHV